MDEPPLALGPAPRPRGGILTEHFLLVGLRLGIVAAGGVVALRSLRLAFRSQDHWGTYLFLGVGFGLVALAAVVEGVLHEVAGWDLAASHTVEAFLSAAAFVLILVAILRSEV